MTRLRYLIAGLIAFLIHGIALSYTPQKSTITVSTEEGFQSLQIQLMTISASKPIKETKVIEDLKSMTQPQAPKPAKAEQPKNLAPEPINKPLEKASVSPKSTKQKHKPVVPKKDQPSTRIVERKPRDQRKETIKPNALPSKMENPETAITERREQTQPANIKTQSSKPMLVKKPRFSAKPTPVTYPKLARKKGLEGKVLIEVWLDEQGNQIKQLLLKSSGHRVLDERALNAIKQWQFSHQVDEGRAIAHRVQIPINFQLQ